MNPNMETKGENPEPELNQVVNEEAQTSEQKQVEMKLKNIPYSQMPMRKGTQFKFEGIVFEVYDVRSRGRAFIRMLGKPVYFDENGEVAQ